MAAARSGTRPHTSTRRMGRTAQWPCASWKARWPVPTTVRVWLSMRERKVEASAEVAAVRRLVSASASMTAVGTPVVPSNRV